MLLYIYIYICIYCLLLLFNNKNNKNNWTKYVASKYIDEHDLYVVEMYVWIYPHLVFSKDFDRVEQVYRNKEQDSIMRNQRTSSTKVKDFTRYFESRGLDVPEIEVDADLKPCSPVNLN